MRASTSCLRVLLAWRDSPRIGPIVAACGMAAALLSCDGQGSKELAETQARLEGELNAVRSELTATTQRVAALEQLLASVRAAPTPPRTSTVALDCPADWERIANAPAQTLWACRTTAPTPAGFWPNCNVTSSSALGNDAPRDYVRTALESAPELREARRLGARDLTLAGLPAHEAQYEHTLGGRLTRVLATIVIRDAQAFAVTCSVTPDLFGSFEPVFHRITSSFRFQS